MQDNKEKNGRGQAQTNQIECSWGNNNDDGGGDESVDDGEADHDVSDGDNEYSEEDDDDVDVRND